MVLAMVLGAGWEPIARLERGKTSRNAMPPTFPDNGLWPIFRSGLKETGNAEPKPSPALEVAFAHCKRDKKDRRRRKQFDFARVGMMSHMTQAHQWLDSWQCLNDARVRDSSRPSGAGNSPAGPHGCAAGLPLVGRR